MAAPSMPADLQIVQPDPSLPKELSAFWGKREGGAMGIDYFLIVKEKGTLQIRLGLWIQVDPTCS